MTRNTRNIINLIIIGAGTYLLVGIIGWKLAILIGGLALANFIHLKIINRKR
jgi:hypothetical protein